MSSAVLASTQIWWFTARAGGLVAWALAALSILWGLALSTRALGRKPRAPWLLDLHRFLGGLTVVFVFVHMTGLWADQYVHFSVTQLLVPFAATWKPLAVAWGVVAFYLLLAVELTSLLRSRVPARVWRVVHLSSFVLFALATIHLLGAGTDRRTGLLRLVVMAVTIGIVAVTMLRLVMADEREQRASSQGLDATPAPSQPASRQTLT